MKRSVIRQIAATLEAMRYYNERKDTEWADKHFAHAHELTRKHLPSGSGFDRGTWLVLNECTESKIVFEAAFHHMNQSGMYTRWTEHKVIVTPAFAGLALRITGRDLNGVKDHIAETFEYALTREFEGK
jgi:hypothetical protein